MKKCAYAGLQGTEKSSFKYFVMRYARLGDLISDFNENKMLSKNEENLARKLAASYLSEFGPIHTALMKPYD
jgi:hypothetical protein